MSITFHIEGAPTERYQPDPNNEPEWWDTRPCEGFYEMNLSNVNAADLLILLGQYKEANELYGKWEQDKISKVLRKVTKIRNTREKDHFEKATTRVGNFIDCGRDSQYVLRRLDTLIMMLKAAKDNQMNIVFG
jgi:hypothetical protein